MTSARAEGWEQLAELLHGEDPPDRNYGSQREIANLGQSSTESARGIKNPTSLPPSI